MRTWRRKARRVRRRPMQSDEPAAKRVAVAPELRSVPKGMQIEAQPKNGACAFHCFSTGLKKISKGKIDKHPRNLRAECIEHMQKHSEEYRASWDGKGPEGSKLDTWEAYITAVSAESAYVSDLEIRALARLYDVRVVLVPQLACFPPVVFHSCQKSPKRCLVMWYSERHLDLLVTEEGKRIPSDITEITASINFELRVGGGPSVASSSEGEWGGPGSVFTDPAPKVQSQSGDGRTAASSSWKTRSGTVWTKPTAARKALPTQATLGATSNLEEEIEASAGNAKPRYNWWGHGIKKVRTYQCELCSFAVAVKGPADLCAKRYSHCIRHHDGEGLPGRKSRAADYIVPIKGPRAKYAWICPLCPYGLPDRMRSALSIPAVNKAKQKHRKQHHARITDSKWKSLCQAKDGSATAAHRVTIFNKETARNFREDTQYTTAGFRKFTWPRPCSYVKKKIEKVTFRTAWNCRRCGMCFWRRSALPKHGPKTCLPDLAKKSRKRGQDGCGDAPNSDTAGAERRVVFHLGTIWGLQL